MRHEYLDWGTGWSRHLHGAGTTVVACLGEELYLLALAKAAEAIGDNAGLQVIRDLLSVECCQGRCGDQPVRLQVSCPGQVRSRTAAETAVVRRAPGEQTGPRRRLRG